MKKEKTKWGGGFEGRGVRNIFVLHKTNQDLTNEYICQEIFPLGSIKKGHLLDKKLDFYYKNGMKGLPHATTTGHLKKLPP